MAIQFHLLFLNYLQSVIHYHLLEAIRFQFCDLFRKTNILLTVERGFVMAAISCIQNWFVFTRNSCPTITNECTSTTSTLKGILLTKWQILKKKKKVNITHQVILGFFFKYKSVRAQHSIYFKGSGSTFILQPFCKLVINITDTLH